ncbi:hypothetical protein LCGC14_1771770, partial [marine sediment metagenome]
MEKQFNTIWGNLVVGTPKPVENPVEKKAEKPGEKKAEKPGEKKEEKKEEKKGDEQQIKVTIEKPGDKPTEEEIKKAAEKAKGEDGDEYEYTTDDVSKAYTMLIEEDVLKAPDSDDDFEGTPSGLADAVSATVQSKLKEEIAAIPPVVQEFYAHVMGGKDTSSFIASKAETVWEDFDINEQANQEIALRAMYKNQEMSDEDIDEEIEDIKAGEKMEKKAEVAKATLTKLQIKTNAAKVTAKETAEAKTESDHKDEVKRIKGEIDGIETGCR